MRAALTCLIAAVTLLLAACGFQLRGAYTLPYESLHIALPDASVIGAGLKRQIRAGGGTRLVEKEEATLKRLRKKSGMVALEAANPNYETRVFGPDQVDIQGRLVGLIRRY